jgi:SHS family sialic acid transporter-like MFS transporter
MALGRALAVLTFAGTVIVVLLVGFDVPGRLNRLTDPDGTVDHLAEAAPETAASPSNGQVPAASR